MPTTLRSLLGRFSLSKIVFAIGLFCVATAIAARAQTLTTLYSFCSQGNCADGSEPSAGLVQATDGNFYGTTVFGGNSSSCNSHFGCGTIFKITPSGTLTTLYSFCSAPNCADGSSPSAALVQATDGNFYGTTNYSGSGDYCNYGCGTVFKITPGGNLTTLHNFDGTDGGYPVAPLVQGSDGNLYGTTSRFGANGAGTVFKMAPNGTLTTLYNLCAQGGSNCTDGSYPSAGLVQASDGNFYGTTISGGTNDNGIGGTVFKITPSGTLTTLYSFCSQPNCADGAVLYAGLVQTSDGNLNGTTYEGGTTNNNCPSGCGTIFKITPSGVLTTLHSFDGTDGSAPGAGLQASDGNFYGVTGGGTNSDGTVFKITPNGTLTTLHSFDGTDGEGPSGLLQASDGNFYGTTYGGGTTTNNCPSGCGTVFSLSGPNPTPFQFVPLTPCRVVDTRRTNGEFGGPPITGGAFRSFPLPQNEMCNIPASATAYSLNVTVLPRTTLGYLTIWPTGESQPVVSTMNSTDGRIKANAAVVPAGGNGGAVSVYASNTTNVILDIDGYFVPPGSGTYQFYPLTPCRIVDTRGGDGGILHAGVERDYTIPPNCGVPSSATAYSFNVTVLPSAGGLDYLTVWPKGESQPVVSTLNDNTGTVVANAAIVPAGNENATAFYPHSNSTNLLLDVNGYFAPAGTGGLSLYPRAPCRVLDTRQNHGQPFSGEKTVNVVGSTCAPPSSAAAYIFNATVVPPGSMPFLTLWPDGETQPNASTLNAQDGFITSNMAIVPTTNGSIDAYAAALTQLLLDISGYFAP